MTTNGDRNEKSASRLEVLPPVEPGPQQAQIDTVVELSRREKSKQRSSKKEKPKRKLQKEPLASESFVDTVVTHRESHVSSGGRKPLPLAAIPAKEVSVDDLAPFEDVELIDGTQLVPSKVPVDLVPMPGSMAMDSPLVEPPSLSGSGQLEAIQSSHHADQAESASLFDQVAKFMSGWATSFVIHMLLIILFAVLTFAMPDESRVLLSLDNVDVEQMDSETFDVSVNFDPIQESSVSGLDDLTPQELSEDFANEMLDAEEVVTELEDFGMETLSGEGAGTKLGDGGSKPSASNGRKGVAGESVDFFGSYAKGKRFVFVIDCSGSMIGERWERAKYELERSIADLNDDQTFCVVLYNSGTRVMMGGRNVELLVANAENREKVSRWLNRQYPNGGTYPRQAVMASLEVEPDAIFLLSDGEIQDNTREFLLASNRNRDNGQGDYSKIPVHTIALLSTFGQQMLRSIADDNEGTFTRVGRR